ncbi:uncharacterized protein SPSK_10655 [Sporothrix schenckii 1099-18]|uniref:Uncharacterized protein n=1 Tax=Sporothrix schenckii 1099-18 TaxID=1397361 RepID=A0A0F2LRP2_SPOSC|nr:uncharacterized protein SPSK_10655 [Sporothrix schenckii 1099-18]KJR80182.1 hypothetical protein SPSK_10655 [Sporothrix schenckii 1099-18]
MWLAADRRECAESVEKVTRRVEERGDVVCNSESCEVQAVGEDESEVEKDKTRCKKGTKRGQIGDERGSASWLILGDLVARASDRRQMPAEEKACGSGYAQRASSKKAEKTEIGRDVERGVGVSEGKRGRSRRSCHSNPKEEVATR